MALSRSLSIFVLNIVCCCLSTVPAVFHPASEILCLTVLLLTAAPSSTWAYGSCQSGFPVRAWHTSQARSSLEGISLDWGRSQAQAHIGMKPVLSPYFALEICFVDHNHIQYPSSPCCTCTQPAVSDLHMQQSMPSSVMVLNGRGADLHTTDFETSVWCAYIALSSWRNYRSTVLSPWPLPTQVWANSIQQPRVVRQPGDLQCLLSLCEESHRSIWACQREGERKRNFLQFLPSLD